MVWVHHGVRVKPLGFYRTRGYGVLTGAVKRVTGMVCEILPVVWPVLHPRPATGSGVVAILLEPVVVAQAGGSMVVVLWLPSFSWWLNVIMMAVAMWWSQPLTRAGP